MDARYSSKEHIHTCKETGLDVYKATLSSGSTICVKEQRVRDLSTSTLLKTLNIQQQLRHRNVCQVLLLKTWREEEMVVRGEMPWLSPSLDFHSLFLRKSKQVWSLSDSFLLLDHISSALSLSQTLKLPHLNLSPSNIYLQPGPLFLLSNYKAESPVLAGIKVDTTFLSPILRQEYVQRVMGNAGQVLHNEYKSDVFSLGVIVLYMNQLEGVVKAPGNMSRLCELINASSYSPAMKALLREMIAAEEAERPDSLVLRSKVRTLIETSLLQPVNSLIQRDTSAARELLSQLLQCSVSLEALVQPPAKITQSNITKCSKCGEPFSLDSTEPWRISLWGSSLAKPSKSICSEACLSLPITTTENRRSKKTVNTIVNARSIGDLKSLHLYFDCQVHICESSTFEDYFRSVSPSLLCPCPECPPIKFMVGKIAGYTVYFPEIYQDMLAFIKLSIPRKKVLGKRIELESEGVQYWPLPCALIYCLDKTPCHLCQATMQNDWRPFIHAQQLFVICSQHCAQTRLPASASFCPTCQAAITIKRRDLARGATSGFEAFLASADPESCCLCIFGPCEVSLDCQHNFCSNCMSSLLRVKSGQEIPCLYCGAGSGLRA